MAHIQATKEFVKKLAEQGRLITKNPQMSGNFKEKIFQI